jgi:hypothetical protein
MSTMPTTLLVNKAQSTSPVRRKYFICLPLCRIHQWLSNRLSLRLMQRLPKTCIVLRN